MGLCRLISAPAPRGKGWNGGAKSDQVAAKQEDAMPFPDLMPDVVADYRSKAVAPADFDDFWSRTLAETGAHPLDARFDKIDAGLPMFKVA